MSPKEINLLLLDCDYLGFKKLSIVIEIFMFITSSMMIAKQIETSYGLYFAKSKLNKYEKDMKRIEGQTSSYYKKQKTNLSENIEKSKEIYENLLIERNKAIFNRSCKVGDRIKINLPDTYNWFEYSVVRDESKEKDKEKDDIESLDETSGEGKEEEEEITLIAIRRDYRTEERIPIPPPTHYYLTSSEISEYDENIVYSDKFLPKLLTQSLEMHLDGLLHSKPLDIHPGSESQVVDLIHPSMYPYIKGITQIIPVQDDNNQEGKEGEEQGVVGGIGGIGKEGEDWSYLNIDESTDYAWLPSEFMIDENGSVTISSYINNLDQDIDSSSSSSSQLYEDIGLVFQSMLPMFQKVVGKKKKLVSRKLQVIVKAAYYLISAGETYSGSWHLEGMPHEHIIASGIYYLSVSNNIKQNHLEFRRELPNDYYHDEDRHHSSGEQATLIEELGYIHTPSKRGVVWGNHLQHKVGALSININHNPEFDDYDSDEIDDSDDEIEKEEEEAENEQPKKNEDDQYNKTGIRKILCFFLVDPDKRVISTEMVPKQQELIPLDVALKHRQTLMNERKYHADEVSGMWEERKYTFCEH